MANAKMNPKKTERQIMEEAGTTFPEYMENLLSQLVEMGYTKEEISRYFHENYALTTEWHGIGYMPDSGVTLMAVASKHPDVVYARQVATNDEMAEAFFGDIHTPQQPGEDVVNHPSHYNQFPGVEVIDITRHLNFNRGNAVKYICRAGLKGEGKTIQDLEKAMWYLKDEIERVRKVACEAHHPGEKCIPGNNHPSVA